MFGKNDSGEKNEKVDKKTRQYMDRFQLEDIDQRDMVIIRRIVDDLAGNTMGKLGVALAGDPADRLQISYLSALVEQNWMIIRQLGRLNSNIENLSNQQRSAREID